MNPKIIIALVNAIISFVMIVPISFFMNKYVNQSEESFMVFFSEKWPILLTFVFIFTAYHVFLKGRKFK